MKIREASLVLAGSVFLTIFPGCSGCSDHSETPRFVNLALIDNPTNLDPRLYSDAASFRIIELVYDFLVRLDSTGRPQPALAWKWDNPSDSVYVFHLRPGIKFHDGKLLHADDVAYTFRSILDPATRAPSRRSFQVIDKIEVQDSLTVVFTLRHAYAPFLSNAMVGIVPRHLAEKTPHRLRRHPIGTGPFRFKKWKSDVYIELEANRDYQPSPPAVPGLNIKILPEETTRILALENREIDFMMNNFPEVFITRFQNNTRLKVAMKTGSNYVYLGTNLKNPYLSDPRVRRAIAYAIDVKGIIRDLLGGIHQPARSLLNPDHWAYHPDLSEYQYDPSAAVALLEEAGYNDPDGAGPQPRFTLRYKCTDKHASRQKAQVVQQYLKQVGIEIEIQSYEWGTFFDDIQNGRFDLYSLTWVGIYEPDLYYQIFHSDNIGSGANRGGYMNAEVDSLIAVAQTTLDMERRIGCYWRIQEILNQELPYIHLWYETNVAVMDRAIAGFKIYPAAEWISFKDITRHNGF